MKLVLILLCLVSLSAFPKAVNSAKILAVAFISSKSHKITYEPLLHALAERGHEVTTISPIPSSKPVKNLRDIITLDIDKQNEEMAKKWNAFEMKEKGEDVNPFKMLEVFGSICEETYDLPQVHELLKEKFDLIIVSAIFNECAAGYIYKFNTSIIQVSPISAQSWILHPIGGTSPTSFVPNVFMGYGQEMNFMERTINFLTEFAFVQVWNWFIVPRFEEIYRNKLGDQSLPGAFEVMRNTSLIISNGHFSMNSPRPFLPDVIEVGGMHTRPAKKLPKDLEDYVASSGDDGFILFSMGSALRGSQMPDHKRKLILGAFAKLKQKVLWKWETETMDDLPKNVKLSKWLPQQDLLGHPKIRAFITHGGFGSSTEAVYHGVPLVGIPMFADQKLNMLKAAKAGYSVTLDYNTLTQEDLVDALKTVINDPSYRENVRALGKVFADQADNPLDRAVFWTEYVLRHKGAPHLRSAARDLNFWQYHSIDVMAFLLSILLTSLLLTRAVFRCICKKLCSSGGKKVNKQKKRN